MDRREELSEFIKEYCEIRKQNKRIYLIENTTKIISAFQEKLIILINEQVQRQKREITDKIKFIFLCRTLSSNYTGNYEAVLGMSDEMLYLDENRSQIFWYPELFYKGVEEDLKAAENKISKKFLHLEDSELFYIKGLLLNDDWELISDFLHIISEQSVSLIKSSELLLEDELNFLCGNYKDNLKIIYSTRMEEEHG